MSSSRSIPARLVVAAFVAAGLIASAGVQSAGASDLDTVRARAQSVADEVTNLERRLEGLHERRLELDERIVTLSSQIGSLEATISDVEEQLGDARDLYVERAVEAYKSGTTGIRLEMLLAAETVSEMVAIAEMNSVAATIDTKRLEELEAAMQATEEAQDDLEKRKQEQIEARVEVEALTDEIAGTLDDRSELLAELADEVEELTDQVRREAAREPKPAPPPPSTPSGPTSSTPSAPAPTTTDVPDGYVSTGVTFGGVASWYGPGFAGNLTANGEIYDPMGLTAASKELPFNTLLFVKYAGRGVVVRINDRGPYVGDRIIDLSQGAAEAVGMSGIGWIDATIVVQR